MDAIFIYSMIFSIFAIYLIGNVSKVLRNLFLFIIFIYSGLFFLQNGGLKLEMSFFNWSAFTFGFSESENGIYLSILNHIIFSILIIKDISKPKHESESSYFMNMLFIFFLTNLILFAKNLLTAIVIYEILIYLILFTITSNVNERKVVNDLLFINCVLSSMFIIALILMEHSAYGNRSIQYILFVLVMAGRLFMIPFNTRFFDSLKNMSILSLGYFLIILFLMNSTIHLLIANFTIGTSSIILISIYIIFAFFMITSLIKALSSNSLKQMMFFTLTLSVSFLSSYAFIMKADYMYEMPIIFRILIPISVLFTETDLIEERFLTTDLRKLSGIGYYIPHSPLMFLMSFVLLMDIPSIIGAFTNHLEMNYLISLKILYTIYMFFLSVILFKIFALLFFSSSAYFGITVMDYRKLSERLYLKLLLFVLLVLILFIYIGKSIQEILIYDTLTGKIHFQMPAKDICFIFMNLLALFVILINIYLQRKFRKPLVPKNYEKAGEILYNESSFTHSFEKNINMNGLNFYGYNESKLNKMTKYSDFDNGVKFIIRTISNIGEFGIRLYQRSMSAVFLIIILFTVLIFILSRGAVR